MTDVLIGIVSFFVFAIFQSIVINGIYMSFQGSDTIENGIVKYNGMILYPLARWLRINIKNEWLLKPIFVCIKCMASFWGGLTFWPTVIYFFGFRYEEIYVYMLDVFSLVFLNYFFYKKV